MDFANIPEARRPAGLDGRSLAKYLPQPRTGHHRGTSRALAAPPIAAGDGARPVHQFVVSQFHGKNIAMSWYFVVQDYSYQPTFDSSGTSSTYRNRGNSNSTRTRTRTSGNSNSTVTYKYLVWGTGAEVPSLLFNLDADPSENLNLIATDVGKAAYKDVVDALDASLKSVVDYPDLSQKVARYNRAIFASYIANLTAAGKDWRGIVASQDYWKASWNVSNSLSLYFPLVCSHPSYRYVAWGPEIHQLYSNSEYNLILSCTQILIVRAFIFLFDCLYSVLVRLGAGKCHRLVECSRGLG